VTGIAGGCGCVKLVQFVGQQVMSVYEGEVVW
jgi:hypothetical protein